MIKLLAVSKEDHEIEKIERQLSGLRQHFEGLVFSQGRPGYIGTKLESETALLIYDAKEVNKHIGAFIREARKKSFDIPIIVLGNIPEGIDINEYLDNERIVFIEKPYDAKDLVGIVWKYLAMIKVQQRIHRRFEVQEKAAIETYNSDFKATTVICDLSQGGARILGSHQGLKKGDLLRVHFSFDEIQKERIMSARVVWVKNSDDNKEEAGLEFVSQKAVYQYLLNYALA